MSRKTLFEKLGTIQEDDIGSQIMAKFVANDIIPYESVETAVEDAAFLSYYKGYKDAFNAVERSYDHDEAVDELWAKLKIMTEKCHY